MYKFELPIQFWITSTYVLFSNTVLKNYVINTLKYQFKKSGFIIYFFLDKGAFFGGVKQIILFNHVQVLANFDSRATSKKDKKFVTI